VYYYKVSSQYCQAIYFITVKNFFYLIACGATSLGPSQEGKLSKSFADAWNNVKFNKSENKAKSV